MHLVPISREGAEGKVLLDDVVFEGNACVCSYEHWGSNLIENISCECECVFTHLFVHVCVCGLRIKMNGFGWMNI